MSDNEHDRPLEPASEPAAPHPRITIEWVEQGHQVQVKAEGVRTLDFALAMLRMAELAFEDSKRAAQQQGPRVVLGKGRVPAPAVQDLLRRR